MSEFNAKVRKAAQERILFTRHALDQMNKRERLIFGVEVREVVEQGEVIEEYPEDPRGPRPEKCSKIRDLLCHQGVVAHTKGTDNGSSGTHDLSGYVDAGPGVEGEAGCQSTVG